MKLASPIPLQKEGANQHAESNATRTHLEGISKAGARKGVLKDKRERQPIPSPARSGASLLKIED